MAIKTPIFRGHDGGFQKWRDRLGGDHAAKLIAAPGEDRALAVHKGHRPGCAPVDHLRGIGQGRCEIGHAEAHQQTHHQPKPPGECPKHAKRQQKDRPEQSSEPSKPSLRRGIFRRLPLVLFWFAGGLRSSAICDERLVWP